MTRSLDPARLLPRQLALAAALLALAPTVALAQSLSERTALAWVEAFNGGEQTMAAFRQDHTAERPGWEEQYRQMRTELGRLEVYGVMEDEALRVGVVSEHQGRLRLVFAFDPDAADRITSLRIEASDGPRDGLPELAWSTASWEERARELDAYVEALPEEKAFAGVVLVADPSGVLLERAYGLASREFDAPNTVQTRFDVGSIIKDYTKLAIHQLAARDQLTLADTVGRHLPDYPNAEVRESVTIQQLLDHTSGLGDYFTEEWFATPMGRLREISDYLPIWGPKPLLGKPGETFR